MRLLRRNTALCARQVLGHGHTVTGRIGTRRQMTTRDGVWGTCAERKRMEPERDDRPAAWPVLARRTGPVIFPARRLI